MSRERLAAGPDEPRLGLTARLEPDGQVLAGLLAGELEGRTPLVVGVEERDASGFFGIEPMQLEGAVASVNGQVAAPVEVEVVEVEHGDDLRLVDGLSVRPDQAALDGLPWPQPRVDFVRRVAGLDLIGDDVVGVIAFAARLAV